MASITQKQRNFLDQLSQQMNLSIPEEVIAELSIDQAFQAIEKMKIGIIPDRFIPYHQQPKVIEQTNLQVANEPTNERIDHEAPMETTHQEDDMWSDWTSTPIEDHPHTHAEQWTDLRAEDVKEALEGLRALQILHVDSVDIGSKSVKFVQFSETGLELFQQHHKQKAVKSELEIGMERFGSMEQAIAVRETANILKRHLFETTIRNQPLKVEHPQPDILATDAKGKSVWINVFLGGMHQQEFDQWMNVLYSGSSEVRFVTSNKKMANQFSTALARWSLNRRNQENPVKGFQLWITTFDKLEKKDWGQFVPVNPQEEQS